MSNPYAQYRQTAVETATPTRLVVMLYDGAIRFLSSALPEMHARRYDAQTRLIGRAQAIIAHLRDTLDFARGGSVARDLETCYIALYDALTDANIHDKTEKCSRPWMPRASCAKHGLKRDVFARPAKATRN